MMNNIRRRLLFSALQSRFLYIYKTGCAQITNAAHSEYETVSVTENGITIVPASDGIPRGMTVTLVSAAMQPYEKLVVTAAFAVSGEGNANCGLRFRRASGYSSPVYNKEVAKGGSFADYEFTLSELKSTSAVLEITVGGSAESVLTISQIYLA